MEGFATGFNLEGKTKPGYSVENEKFKLTFSGVLCDERKNIVSHGFECCYDWSEIMDMILAATEDYDSRYDIEDKVEKMLKTWLTSFQGWGLLSSMLPTQKHRYFLVSLAYASANWNEETGGPYSTQKIFDTVKYVYEHSPGKEIHHLVPPLGTWFEEIFENDEVVAKSKERMKSFTMFFNAKWMLEVKFTMEKKRVNNNLVDIAAERVAQSINDIDDIERLEIPTTLFDRVYDKCIDVEWVTSYWNFKSELEANRSEIDVNELEEICDEADHSLGAIENIGRDEVYENEALDNSLEYVEEVSDHFVDGKEISTEKLGIEEVGLKAWFSTLFDRKETNFVTWVGIMCIPLVILAYVCF